MQNEQVGKRLSTKNKSQQPGGSEKQGTGLPRQSTAKKLGDGGQSTGLKSTNQSDALKPLPSKGRAPKKGNTQNFDAIPTTPNRMNTAQNNDTTLDSTPLNVDSTHLQQTQYQPSYEHPPPTTQYQPTHEPPPPIQYQPEPEHPPSVTQNQLTPEHPPPQHQHQPPPAAKKRLSIATCENTTSKAEFKIAQISQLQPWIENDLKRTGLLWEDVAAVLEIVYEDDLKEPSTLLEKLLAETVGPVAQKMQIAKLRSRLEQGLHSRGLAWRDVVPALEMFDLSNLRRAEVDPQKLLQQLMAEEAGPLAKKMQIAKLRPKMEPLFERHGLAWEDAVLALDMIDSIELRKAVEDPQKLLQKLMAEVAGPVAKKILIAKVRPRLTPYLKKHGLGEWQQVVPLLDAMGSTDLRQAVQDPSKLLGTLMTDGTGQVTRKMVIVRLQPVLQQFIQNHNLVWADTTPVLEMVDSIEELHDAIADPSRLIQTLMAEATGPVAKKMFIAKLHPLLKETLTHYDLSWEDVAPALDMIDAIELQEGLNDPQKLFGKLMGEVGGPLGKKMLIAKIRPEMEPHARSHGLVWEDLVPALDMLDSIELCDALKEPLKHFQKLMAENHGQLGKTMRIAQIRPKLQLYLKQQGLKWQDILPVLATIGSAQELQKARVDPNEFIQNLVAQMTEPLTTKILIAKLRPKLEPYFEASALQWEDVVSVLETMDSVAELSEAVDDPQKLLKKLMTGSAGKMLKRLGGLVIADAYFETRTLRQTAEMVETMKNGAASIRDMALFVVNQCEEDPVLINLVKDKVTSFGILRWGRDKDLPAALQDDDLEDVEVEEIEFETDNPLLQLWASVVALFAVHSLTDVAAKHEHRPELCNPEMGAKILQYNAPWKSQLSACIWLSKYAPWKGSFFIFIYFLTGFWLLPGITLITVSSSDKTNPKDEFRPPSEVTGTWEVRNTLWFAILLLLPFGLVKSAILVRNNIYLETCGSMLWKLQLHYRPGTGKSPKHWALSTESNQTLKRIWMALRAIATRFNKMRLVCICVSLLLVTGHYTVNKFMKTWNPYWLVHLILANGFLYFALSTIFPVITLICATCLLVKQNIIAYSEVLDVLCLQVDLTAEREKAKIVDANLNKPLGDRDTQDENMLKIVALRVTEAPMIVALQEQLWVYEEYLVALAESLTQGELGRSINFLYGIMTMGYFFILFWLYVIFIEVQVKGKSAQGELTVAGGIALCTALSIIAVARPLLRMARQADAWEKLTNVCKTETRQRVSQILSPKYDPFFLANHHQNLQEIFTWKVLGGDMRFRTIYSGIAGYFAVLWATSVLPAIQNYADQVKDDLQSALNHVPESNLTTFTFTWTNRL